MSKSYTLRYLIVLANCGNGISISPFSQGDGVFLIITFCGHSDNFFSEVVKEQVKNIFYHEVGFSCVYLYFIQVGTFEKLVLNLLKELKDKKIRCCFISFNSKSYKIKRQIKDLFDEIIITSDIKKCKADEKNDAIAQWVVDKSNIIVSYVNYRCGMPYLLVDKAVNCNKKCYNFGNLFKKKAL